MYSICTKELKNERMRIILIIFDYKKDSNSKISYDKIDTHHPWQKIMSGQLQKPGSNQGGGLEAFNGRGHND